jgi:hypothetical protein
MGATFQASLQVPKTLFFQNFAYIYTCVDGLIREPSSTFHNKRLFDIWLLAEQFFANLKSKQDKQ